jgi:predicted branched-subunit amino acid permease
VINLSEVRAGLRQVLPVLVAVLPFGLVYGAIATDAGMTVGQTVGFSAAVYGGASQFVALEMIGVGSPVILVALSVFALNFRHVLYSASIGRKLTRFSPVQKAAAFFLLTDPTFASAEARAAEKPLTKTFYFAYNIALYIAWLLSSLAGALFGGLIEDPKAFALDFILPVYFLTLLMGFRARTAFYPVVFASAVTSIVLFVTVGPPWHVTFGALGGILYAVLAPLPKPAAVGPDEAARAAVEEGA